MSSPIIIKNLQFAYPDQPALWRGLNFTLSGQQKIGIWGPNGAGKTTLFNLIMGLIPAQGGDIYLNNVLCRSERQFAGQRTSIGYAFQNPDDQIFCATVYDEVAFAPLNLGFSKARVQSIVGQMLDLFHLSGYEQSITYRLSGGEKRMLSLAAVWALQPQALLLDEPTLSLDEKWLAVLRRVLQQSAQPWLMASHDRCFLEDTCELILQIKDGQLLNL